MVKVKSLSQRIVLQFAAILLPFAAVLVYDAVADANRASRMDHALVLHHEANTAKERYSAFLNGAADAVDTGRLSAAALRALDAAAASVERQAALDDTRAAALAGLHAQARAAADVLRAEPTIAMLTRLRQSISDMRSQLEQSAVDRQASLDHVIRFSIRDTERTRNLVFTLAGIVLLVTTGFVVQMIRGLSRPLRLAVEVADRIAEGRRFEGFTVDPRQDIGNLLGSLQRMHESLRGFEADVERQRIGLEQKVRELAQSERSLAQAQRSAKLGSWQWDAGAAKASWSEQMQRILGLGPDRPPATLRTFLRATPQHERRALVGHLRSLAGHGDEVAVEHHVSGAGGDDRIVHHQAMAERDAAGRLLRLCGTLQDVTDRQRAEQKMRQLALYDGLTGLANRQFFNEHLRSAIAHSRRSGSGLATLFIDLDRFKRINDTLGHAAGDALLRQAAERVLGCVRESDTVSAAAAESASMVARLGGDEFIVLLRDVLTPRDAAVVAGRIVKALGAPFLIDRHELVVTASIGIAMHPSDGDSDEALVKAADAAMYVAKGMGRNTFQFFTKEMNTIASEKLELEIELRRAVESGQFLLHYQPKVDIASGAIAGVEALIRWNHPRWGLVPPGRFIPLAEELGLIVQIGDWVLEEACRQAAIWRRAGLGEISVAVNLASPSFRKPGLVGQLSDLLGRHGLGPGQLQIEATESMLMESSDLNLRTLQDLHGLGIRLSIDDFGTGYSSLAYLRRFPVDQLKIDRSFVSEVTKSTDDVAIAAAIVSLGFNLKREVVAEGVETKEQMRLLRGLGCHLMQGFLFSRPLPAEELDRLLGRDRPFAWASTAALCEPA